MKSSDWLKEASIVLNDTPTARLDALVLLEDAVGKDRGWLLAHPEFEISDKIATLLQLQIEKRAKHTPLAYIRGKSEFYGREFLVTPDTLQPRSETETMIDLLKNLLLHNSLVSETGSRKQGKDVVVLDVGTGSGCLAITTKLELPGAEVYATEINSAALKIAKQNAKKLGAEIVFKKGNLIQPLVSIIYRLPTILICNLPYVPDSHTINEAAMQEPHIAIFGGEDGLDLYRKLFQQLLKLQAQGSIPPSHILTESLPFQHKSLTNLAKKCGYKQIAKADFIQVFTIARD